MTTKAKTLRKVFILSLWQRAASFLKVPICNCTSFENNSLPASQSCLPHYCRCWYILLGCAARLSWPQTSSKPLFLFTTDVFPILTSPHHLTPERFHDFLSLSTSPPLPYNHNLHHNQERPTTATEEPTKEERGTSPSNGGRPTSDTPSAPSFAQVGTKRDVIGSRKCPSLASFPVLCESGVYTLFVLQALQGKPPPVWPIKSTSSSRGVHSG